MKKKAFFILLMTSFSAMLGIGIISPFLPRFAEQYGANGFWLGMIFAGFGISRAIVVPFVGKISDKTGRKLFISIGIIIYIILSLIYPLARGVIELTFIRLVHGLALGMIIPIVLAYVGDIAEKGKEAVTVTSMNMMFYMGLAACPLIGGILDQQFGFNAVFHAIAILGGINLVIVFFVLPDIKGHVEEKKKELGKFSVLIQYNVIKAVLIIAMMITLMMTVFISFVPSLAKKVNVDTSHIGFIIFLGVFVAGILQIPFAKLADKLDRFGKLFQVGTGVIISMFAMLSMPFCPGFTALWIAGVILGLGTSISVPAMVGVSVTIGQRAGMGSWMGILNAFQSLAFVITPLLFGITMDLLGIDAVFYLIVLVVIFAGIWYFHFVRRRIEGHLK